MTKCDDDIHNLDTRIYFYTPWVNIHITFLHEQWHVHCDVFCTSNQHIWVCAFPPNLTSTGYVVVFCDHKSGAVGGFLVVLMGLQKSSICRSYIKFQA